MRSLHDRIRTDLKSRILDGDLRPGDRLPTEAEFTRAYDCSRMTVSKALTALVEDGLVVRRKRGGTVVASPRLHSMILDIPDIREEVTKRGQRHSFTLERRRVRSPRRDAVEGELAQGGKLLELRGTHFANGAALALEFRVVSLVTVAAMEHADVVTESPGGWLLKNVPWTAVETTVAAVACAEADAKALGVRPGAACLSIKRRSWRGEQPVGAVHMLFVGESYALRASFGAADLRGR